MEGFEPKPAKKEIPNWYKEIESQIYGEKKPDHEGVTNQTVKRCMPLFDAMSAGYIIYSWVDVYVANKDEQLWYTWPMLEPIQFHPIAQAPNYPKTNGQNYPKWMNPWSISTPPGYSCLFTPPMHRDAVFKILEGVVDTDTYTNPINFPFTMNNIDFEGLIPAGTPIAQVIPFKRDEWKLKFGGDAEVRKAHKDFLGIGRRFFDGYRNHFRQPKEYQ